MKLKELALKKSLDTLAIQAKNYKSNYTNNPSSENKFAELARSAEEISTILLNVIGLELAKDTKCHFKILDKTTRECKGFWAKRLHTLNNIDFEDYKKTLKDVTDTSNSTLKNIRGIKIEYRKK